MLDRLKIGIPSASLKAKMDVEMDNRRQSLRPVAARKGIKELLLLMTKADGCWLQEAKMSGVVGAV